MKSTRWIGRPFYGLALLVFAGCYSPVPYGYTTYPGVYGGPPPAYMAPGGPVIQSAPPGSFPSPQLGPATPVPSGTPAWSPSPATGQPLSPTPISPPSGSLNNNGPPFNNPIVRKPEMVPDPLDDADPRKNVPGSLGQGPLGPGSLGSGSSGPPPIGSPPIGPPRSSLPGTDNKSPFESDGSQPTFDKSSQSVPPAGADSAPQTYASGAQFQPPLERDPPSREILPVRKTLVGKVRTVSGNTYDYDPAGYTYLRGRVDFDPTDKTWHIIYSPKPDAADPYCGAFELVNNPRLSELHDGDYVSIEGRVSLKSRDRNNKPKYEVTSDQIARIANDPKQPVGN